MCRFYSTAYFIHVVVKPCPHFIKQAGNATTLPIAVSQNVCQKPLERGSCARKRARYFYNAEKSRCENFGACPIDGDVNNFATKEECVAKCQSDSPFVQVGNAATLPIAVSQSPSIKVGIAVTLPLALNDNSAAVAVLPQWRSRAPQMRESPAWSQKSLDCAKAPSCGSTLTGRRGSANPSFSEVRETKGLI